MSGRWVWRYALALATLVCLGLGGWQLYRLQWKTALIERVNARVHAPAQPAPSREDWPGLIVDNAEYRRVRLEGTLQHQHTSFVQAVTRLGAGFWVMTPLTLADGSTVFINRGFVPKREAASAPTPQAAEITGLLRFSEPGGGFLRQNDPQAERWYSRDITALAQARGLQNVAPYFIDAQANALTAPGEPVGGLTVIAFRNHHLVYALTWFTLAFMILLRVWQIRRRQPKINEA